MSDGIVTRRHAFEFKALLLHTISVNLEPKNLEGPISSDKDESTLPWIGATGTHMRHILVRIIESHAFPVNAAVGDSNPLLGLGRGHQRGTTNNGMKVIERI